MSYLELVAGRARQERHLVDVLLELTYACNLDCFFCYNDRGIKGQPLTVAQYERLLGDLADLGVWTLSLTGGEPLAHPDFFAIGEKARELGFVVRIKTNGHALHKAMAERIREEIAPFALEISLHGATSETHDRQTRVPGSFERLMDNLEVLRQLGQRVRLRTTLTAWNAHETEAMLELADRLGFAIDCQAEVTQRDDGDVQPLLIRPTPQMRLRLLQLQRERHGSSAETKSGSAEKEGETLALDVDRPNCGAGLSGLAIDPVGNVYPCVQWRRPIGNLHKHSIREIWVGGESLERVRSDNLSAARAVSLIGSDLRAVLFCPGSAELETGKPDGIYEEVRVQAAIADVVKR